MDKRDYEAKGDYYGDEASKYDEKRFSSLKGKLYNRLQLGTLRRMLAKAPEGAYVCDVPCGTGRVGEVILERTGKLVCGDISDDMLGVARKKLEKYDADVTYAKIDAEHMAYPDNTFDVITSIKLMHLLPYDIQKKCLAEFARTTKKWVIATYSYKGSMKWAKDYLMGKKYDSINPSSSFPRRLRELEVEMQELGLSIAERAFTFRLFSEEVIYLLEKKV